MTDHICNHLRRYLIENQVSVHATERAAGVSDGNLVKLLRGKQKMTPTTFNKLAPIVHWTPDCAAECAENWQRILRIRRAGKPGVEPTRVPWQVTVQQAKDGQHRYATVPMR